MSIHAASTRTPPSLAATQPGRLAHLNVEEEGAVEKVLEQTLMLLRTLNAQHPLTEHAIAHALATIARALLSEGRDGGPSRLDALTQREIEVMRCVADGASNLEIAMGLVISERTVESHVSHALSKLQLRSRAQLAAWATEHYFTLPPVPVADPRFSIRVPRFQSANREAPRGY